MINDSIAEIIRTARTIAVVGISEKPHRESNSIARYLQRCGYEIIPVNPALKDWNGSPCYPDLLSIPIPIDVVNIFRRSEFVSSIVDEAIQIGAKAVWMQLDVVDEDAANRAEAAGLKVVMDRCISVEHQRFAKRI